MAKRGTVLAPSCFFPYRVAQNASGPGIDFMVSEMRAMLDMLPAAHAAGVKIVLGDDYGTLALPHGMYGQELAFYVEHAKVSPRDVITWATVNGAAMMGKADELGDLKPGMLADLLIVKGDPIADIGLLGDPANVLTVMKAGKLEKNSLPVRHAREARQGRGAATA
jgi:imidazolonepropionase-like amidohydrolase